jgi:predicted DNA-binding WGR domain protein
MKFGNYQNTNLLDFFAQHTDIEVEDNSNHTPMYYASLQKNGVMKQALLDNGASEEEISENAINRVTSSILNNFAFPKTQFDFEQDYNTFNEYIEEEEKRNPDLKKDSDKVQPHKLVQGGKYEVIYEDNDPFSIFMIKVEISRGYYSGNTFYRMQLLRDKIRGVIVLFTNWGRTGSDGQYQHTPFGSVEEGKAEFTKIFKSKSGNKWENRADFQKVRRKYKLVTYKKKNKAQQHLKKINYKDPSLVPSKLEENIFKFIRRIANSKIISKSTEQFGFDEEVLPFHNLTRDRLEKANGILMQIQEIITSIQKNRQKGIKFDPESADLLTDLTNEFYELIPTTKYRTTSIPPLTSTW